MSLDGNKKRTADDSVGSDQPAVDPENASLRVRDLSVTFGDLSVLSGVDMDVESGELVGLVGPNGAGKTTLLRAIRGSLEPDAGEVTVGGDRLDALSAKAASRRIASVPQNTALSFEFTVEQVVEMGRNPHLSRFSGPGPEDVAAVERAMARTDVAQFADRSITEVSGGERQRILLARALAQATPVLLLDEPTASLDVNHAVRTLELVRGLVDEGRSAIAAIHDLNLAARYCDRLVLLADGGVLAAGTPDQVLGTETLRTAFDARAIVTDQPATGAPLVTPLPELPTDAEGGRVHVVGAGDRTATAVGRLVAAGHDVSLGVVPSGDIAADTARDLDVERVLVPAFAGVNDDAAEAGVEVAGEADAVVVVGEPPAGNRRVADAVDGDQRVLIGCRSLDGRRVTAGAIADAVAEVLDEGQRSE